MDAFGNGGFEAERFINDGNVVVDSLWDTNDSNLKFSLLYLFRKNCNSSMSSIPSNDIQLINASLSKSIDDLITIESTP